jgi:hypothetical protein
MSIICRSAKEVLRSSESIIASSESNDCFVYAFATAFDIPYDEAHSQVKEKFGREDKRGTKSSRINRTFDQMFNSPDLNVNGKTVEEILVRPTSQYKLHGEVKNRSLRVGSFAKKYASGTYLIYTRSHALTIKDGTVIDVRTGESVKSLVKRAYKIGTGQ